MAASKKAENLPEKPESEAPGPQLDVVKDWHESEVSFRDDYELTPEVLGEGMCGSVMKAVHRATGREVAVKIQKLTKMTTADLMDLDREITIQSSIHHENVAQLEAVYRSEEKLHMVCEYLDGGDVCDDLIESGPVSESKAALVIRQVLEAVEDLHGRGIVHRDIKPENIVYANVAQDRVKLIDFGLSAFWHEGMKPMKRICGTTSYLAPEVMKKRYTNKADLWSVGATTYTMITGEKLHWDARAPVLACSPRFRQCSQDAQDFVTKMLSMSASSRPTASEALAHSWIRGGNGVCSAPAPAPAAACARPRPPQEEPPACAAPTGPVALSAPALRSVQSALPPASSRGVAWLTSTPSPSAPATIQQGAKEEDNAKKSIWQRSAFGVRLGRERAAALFAAVCGRSKTTARVRPEMDMYAVVPPM